MRIVGGKYAGRDLMSPADARVRPTAELVRVAALEMLYADVKNARVLSSGAIDFSSAISAREKNRSAISTPAKS